MCVDEEWVAQSLSLRHPQMFFLKLAVLVRDCQSYATSCVDVLPTILQVTKNPIPGSIDGTVLPGFRVDGQDQDSSVYALEAKLSSKRDPFNLCTLAIIKDRYKLIRYQGHDENVSDELYDLENDPEELENLNSTHRSVSKEMGDELVEKIREVQERG